MNGWRRAGADVVPARCGGSETKEGRAMTDRDAIEANVRNKIKDLKTAKVTAMSVDNLRQITRTVGVFCAVAAYPALFREVAIDAGKALGFSVTD